MSFIYLTMHLTALDVRFVSVQCTYFEVWKTIYHAYVE